MPETLLAVRYKKTGVAKIIYTPIIPIVGRKKKDTSPEELPDIPKKPFQNPLKLFTKLDIVLLLLINAIICAVFYGIIASISTLFNRTYGLNESKIGLCFLAIGGGMAIGSSISGKSLDKWYEAEKKRFMEQVSTDPEKLIDSRTLSKLPDFPLERVSPRGSLKTHISLMTLMD
jgi:hypothetical protein